MSLFKLKDRLIVKIASNLDQKDVKSLLQTNRRLSKILTPRFYDIALNNPSFKRKFSLETVMQWAAIEGHETPIRQISERGGDITVRNKDGSTLLHLAAENGHEGVVRVLLTKGADISAQDRSGATPLHLAAEKGYDGIFSLVQRVWRGSRFDRVVNITDRAGCTPLHPAAANNRPAIVRILLDEGADITITNVRHKSALHLAAEKGHDVVVKLLMEHGAAADTAATFLDRGGNSPLHSAAKNGYEAVVRVLLDMGVDCTTTTRFGATALHWAAKMGHLAVVAALLENEAIVDAKTEDESESTPLHWVAESACWMTLFKGRDPLPIVKRLLKKGADVNITDANGKTVLHHAAENGEYATRRKEEKNTPGRSPRGIKALDSMEQHAIQAAHQTLVTLLIEREADVNTRDNLGMTPLHCAAAYGDEHTVKLLLHRGAEIEAKNNSGKTPLEAGSEYPGTSEAEGVTRVLLDYGAQRTDQLDCESTTLSSLYSTEPEEVKRISMIVPVSDKRKSLVIESGAKPLEKPELHFFKVRVTGFFGPASFISRLVHWRRNKT